MSDSSEGLDEVEKPKPVPAVKKAAAKGKASTKATKKKVSKELQGDLAYTPSHGVLKKFLEIASEAARPEMVNYEYLESKQLTGGSAKAVPPLLKKMNFLDSGGKPTEVYAKFQTGTSRSEAALVGLKSAFKSVFDRNRFSHTLSKEKVKDIIIEITGLERSSSTLRAMMGTFDAIKSFINIEDLENKNSNESQKVEVKKDQDGILGGETETSGVGLGLRYNINVVLPDTSDITVYNAIFKSIKENLL